MGNNFPFWFSAFERALIQALAVCLLVILGRFFVIQVRDVGVIGAYAQGRVKLGLSVSALLVGVMLNAPMLVDHNSGFGLAMKVIGLLCMARCLSPGAWGRHSWMIAGILSTGWAILWAGLPTMEMLRW